MRSLSRTAFFPLVVIVILVYLASQTLLPRSDAAGSTEIAYSELIDRVSSSPDTIESVLFVPDSNGIDVTFRDGSVAASHYPTEASQVRFQEQLERQAIAFDSKGSGKSGWWSIFTYLLPFALFFGFWFFLLRQAKGGSWPGLRRERSRHPDPPDG